LTAARYTALLVHRFSCKEAQNFPVVVAYVLVTEYVSLQRVLNFRALWVSCDSLIVFDGL
jgi:hypothetical protein